MNVRTVSMIAGAIATFAVFIASMALFVFGGHYTGEQLLVHLSLALAPLLMISAMVGYGVWWLSMFILSLFTSSHDKASSKSESDD